MSDLAYLFKAAYSGDCGPSLLRLLASKLIAGEYPSDDDIYDLREIAAKLARY